MPTRGVSAVPLAEVAFFQRSAEESEIATSLKEVLTRSYTGEVLTGESNAHTAVSLALCARCLGRGRSTKLQWLGSPHPGRRSCWWGESVEGVQSERRSSRRGPLHTAAEGPHAEVLSTIQLPPSSLAHLSKRVLLGR